MVSTWIHRPQRRAERTSKTDRFKALKEQGLTPFFRGSIVMVRRAVVHGNIGTTCPHRLPATRPPTLKLPLLIGLQQLSRKDPATST